MTRGLPQTVPTACPDFVRNSTVSFFSSTTSCPQERTSRALPLPSVALSSRVRNRKQPLDVTTSERSKSARGLTSWTSSSATTLDFSSGRRLAASRDHWPPIFLGTRAEPTEPSSHGFGFSFSGLGGAGSKERSHWVSQAWATQAESSAPQPLASAHRANVDSAVSQPWARHRSTHDTSMHCATHTQLAEPHRPATERGVPAPWVTAGAWAPADVDINSRSGTSRETCRGISSQGVPPPCGDVREVWQRQFQADRLVPGKIPGIRAQEHHRSARAGPLGEGVIGQRGVEVGPVEEAQAVHAAASHHRPLQLQALGQRARPKRLQVEREDGRGLAQRALHVLGPDDAGEVRRVQHVAEDLQAAEIHVRQTLVPDEGHARLLRSEE